MYGVDDSMVYLAVWIVFDASRMKWIITHYQVFTPTDAQGFKESIKIYIKTAPTCFGVITIIRERTIWAC